MSVQNEFPDFTLDVPIPAGWEDTSWHNNACPSFQCGSLWIWIDYADPAKSERVAWGGTTKRFLVTRLDPNGDHNDEAPVFETDDWQEVLDNVARG